MRYFVPSTENYFAGEKYEYVMVDNGCNSFLLPYRAALVARFSGVQYRWIVSTSVEGHSRRCCEVSHTHYHALYECGDCSGYDAIG